MNDSEKLFKSFVNLLNINFNNITIERVDTEWYSKRNLRSCDFIVEINAHDTPLKCGVEVKGIGYDTYNEIKKNLKTILEDTKGNAIIKSASFTCSPSKSLIKSIEDSSQQLKDVVEDRFPSILLLYPCPNLYNVVINDEDIDEWMQHEEMNKGLLKKCPHINGIALLDVYAGKVVLNFYKNPYSTIPMGWEYNILFNDVKEYLLDTKS